MEKITLYTTHCPQCRVLESKLNAKQIHYEVCEDMDVMENLGIMSVPQLKVGDGQLMSFMDAVRWVGEQ